MIIMENIRAVIFDMDGVIADSEHLHMDAERLILRQHGIEVPASEWHEFTGQTDQKIFQYIVDNFSDGRYTADELIAAKYSIFLDMLRQRLQPISGVMDYLDWAKTHYEKLALTTSSRRIVQQTIFETLRLHSYFDVVITGDCIQRGKPHPEPYLKTLAALNLSASECMVVEDSLNGVKSAKAAGCRVAGITTTFSKARLLECGADLVIDHFSELRAQ